MTFKEMVKVMLVPTIVWIILINAGILLTHGRVGGYFGGVLGALFAWKYWRRSK